MMCVCMYYINVYLRYIRVCVCVCEYLCISTCVDTLTHLRCVQKFPAFFLFKKKK